MECGNTIGERCIMELKVRYAFSNGYLIYRQMKQCMKDEEQGRMTREDCAEAITELAAKLIKRAPDTETQELDFTNPVIQGLRERNMI